MTLREAHAFINNMSELFDIGNVDNYHKELDELAKKYNSDSFLCDHMRCELCGQYQIQIYTVPTNFPIKCLFCGQSAVYIV